MVTFYETAALACPFAVWDEETELLWIVLQCLLCVDYDVCMSFWAYAGVDRECAVTGSDCVLLQGCSSAQCWVVTGVLQRR